MTEEENKPKHPDECPAPRNSNRSRMTQYAAKRGYWVDEDGRPHSPTGRILRGCIGSNGYQRFSIRRPDGGHANVAVHQLAALLKFGKAALAPGVHIRHLDGDPLNNRPSNLELGTAHQNIMDRPRAARVAHAKRAASFLRKMSRDQVEEARRMYEGGAKLKDIAAKYGVAMSTASYVVNRKTYR